MTRSGDGLRARDRAEAAVFVERFVTVSILVIGDVMLDEYVWGGVRRISPEAPVPVVQLERRTYLAGGAANAAVNIAFLDGQVSIGGVVGRDSEADLLRTVLAGSHVDINLIPDERPTTTKTRVMGGSQQILRIDREAPSEITRDSQAALLSWAADRIPSVDGVLISDYDKGVVTHDLSIRLVDLARSAGNPVVVDPKGRDYSRYAGATVITPNVEELQLAVESVGGAMRDLDEAVAALRSVLPDTAIAVTRGSDGMMLYEPDGSIAIIPSRPRDVFDVTGAGDTLAATLALGLAAGATVREAATIANAAAGLSVGSVGTRAVDREELVQELTAQRDI